MGMGIDKQMYNSLRISYLLVDIYVWHTEFNVVIWTITIVAT